MPWNVLGWRVKVMNKMNLHCILDFPFMRTQRSCPGPHRRGIIMYFLKEVVPPMAIPIGEVFVEFFGPPLYDTYEDEY